MGKYKRGMEGKHHSEETKLKISLAKKGKRCSPNTEFKIGSKGHNITHSEETKLKISNTSIGKHYSPNNEFKKYGDGKRKTHNNILRSHIKWCKENQIHRIPFNKNKDGCMIHHIDGNKENDNYENLQLMTRDFHTLLHRSLL